MTNASRSVLPGYGVAGLSTALATAVQFPLRSLGGSEPQLSFFYVAVLITAWYGGRRRAILALALGALAAAYFLPPSNSLAVAGSAAQLALALYVCVGLTAALLIDVLRRQRQAAEERVQSQTLFLAREQAMRAEAQEAQRRLAEEQVAVQALTEQLRVAREELGGAQAEVQRQRQQLDLLTRSLAL